MRSNQGSAAKAFLLTWNPAYGGLDFAEVAHWIQLTAQGRLVPSRWNTGGTTKMISPGDRAYLLGLGTAEHGIFASGHFTSEIYQRPHWYKPGRLINSADVDWDVFLDPSDVLPGEELKARFPENHWRPRVSGTRVARGREDELEALWLRHAR